MMLTFILTHKNPIYMMIKFNKKELYYGAPFINAKSIHVNEMEYCEDRAYWWTFGANNWLFLESIYAI